MQYIQSTEGADSGEGQYNSPSAYRTHDTVSQLWYTGLWQVIFAIQPFSLTLKAIQGLVRDDEVLANLANKSWFTVSDRFNAVFTDILQEIITTFSIHPPYTIKCNFI